MGDILMGNILLGFIFMGNILVGVIAVGSVVVGIGVACTIIVAIVMPVIDVRIEVWRVAVSALIEVGKIAMCVDVPPALAVRVIAVWTIGMIEMVTIKMFISVR